MDFFFDLVLLQFILLFKVILIAPMNFNVLQIIFGVALITEKIYSILYFWTSSALVTVK